MPGHNIHRYSIGSQQQYTEQLKCKKDLSWQSIHYYLRIKQSLSVNMIQIHNFFELSFQAKLQARHPFRFEQVERRKLVKAQGEAKLRRNAMLERCNQISD